MITGTRTQEFKERAQAYFNSKTPAHIITVSDKWLNGFIVEVSDFTLTILDKDGSIKVHYIDLRIFEEYRGSVSKLPQFKGETK